MDRDAFRPVAVFSIAVLVVTGIASGVVEFTLGLPAVYAEAVSNGGTALVLVAVLALFEWVSYGAYREKGLARIGADTALVFLSAAVATVLAVAGLEAAGLDGIGWTLGGLSVDGSSVLVGIAAFGVAVYVFYARNRDCYNSRRGGDRE